MSLEEVFILRTKFKIVVNNASIILSNGSIIIHPKFHEPFQGFLH